MSVRYRRGVCGNASLVIFQLRCVMKRVLLRPRARRSLFRSLLEPDDIVNAATFQLEKERESGGSESN